VAKFPGVALRIAGIEISKQLWVVKVLEARTVIRHGVGGALDVIQGSEITKMALVQAGEAEKIRRRACGSGGAFAVSDHRRDVVT
jgi:hypothetical protein